MKALFLMASFFGSLAQLFGGTPSSATYQTVAIYDQLRSQILSLKPEQIQATPNQPIIGMLMETGYPEAVATLVAVADGTASLYFSKGGGIIGAGQHAGPNKAAKKFIAEATRHLGKLTPAKTFPLPAKGHTRFYVITPDAVLTADADENDLGEGQHALSPLFYAGQELITEMRLSEEQKRK